MSPIQSLFRSSGMILGVTFFVIFFIKYFDWSTALIHFSSVNLLMFVWATIFFIIGTIARSLKWVFILRESDSIGWVEGTHAVFVSNFANYLFPIRIGEFLRLYVVKKIMDVPYASSTSCSVIDRLSSTLIIILCLVFYPVSGFRVFNGGGNYLWLFGIVGLISIGVLLFGHIFARLIPRAIGFSLKTVGLSNQIINKVINFRFINFTVRMLVLCNITRLPKPAIALVMIVSIIILFLDAVSFHFLLKSFGLSISLIQALIAAGLFNIAFALPSAPGQIGNAELIPVIVFVYGLGLPTEIVSSLAILWHVVTMLIIISLGIYSSLRLGLNIYTAISDLKQRGTINN